MVTALAGYAVVVMIVPAMWLAQKIHDWWSEPSRAFYRRVWLTRHHLKLRAGSSLAARRGSTVLTGGVEHPHPAWTSPGAGPQHQAVDGARQPAPGVAVPSGGLAEAQTVLPTGGLGPTTSDTAGAPVPAVSGSQLQPPAQRGWGPAGVLDPETSAPAQATA